MFNRQPFNRGKFNTPITQSIGNNGIAVMMMKANSTLASRIISAIGTSDLSMREDVKGTIVKYNTGTSEIWSGSQGEGTKVFIVEGGTSNIRMYTEANQVLAGESVISLEGIILKPGDELVINTCDMTVTLNGQNAMEYFSNESDFFTLLNGLNSLIYSDDSNSSRNISFDIIWKDRWL